MAAITGTAPHPGTTFPCPELPIDLSRLPIAVFCPMARLVSQLKDQFGYSMGNAPYKIDSVERFDANHFPCPLISNCFVGDFVWTYWFWDLHSIWASV